MSKRNRVRIQTVLDGEIVSHFSLHEFENGDGLVMVNSTLLESLERTRAELGRKFREEVCIVITDGIRTQADLERLGEQYGWTDDGGTVSRESKHLTKFGGIACDFRAQFKRTRYRIDSLLVGNIAREFFDWIKDDYMDGHVHADNRIKGKD